jgi:hypothetical protein
VVWTDFVSINCLRNSLSLLMFVSFWSFVDSCLISNHTTSSFLWFLATTIQGRVSGVGTTPFFERSMYLNGDIWLEPPPPPFVLGWDPLLFKWLAPPQRYIYIYMCVPAPLLNLWKQMVDYIGNHGSMTGREHSKAVNESPLMKISGSTIA